MSKTNCDSAKYKKPFFCKPQVIGDFILLYNEQPAAKNSFSTYVCYPLDGLFWLNLYV